MRVVILAATLVLATGACAASPEAKVERASASASRASALVDSLVSEIRYEIDGEPGREGGSADITIETPSGTSQQNGVDVPLRSKSGDPYLRFAFTSGDFVYLSAQNQSFGSITCRIRAEDGSVISENTASGQYAIATCKGKAP